uniref:Uncharacterized protein n=2 Tax=Cacopsylla melanoneura TaxID=428564 RepID=A0A8D8V015_9HEMI
MQSPQQMMQSLSESPQQIMQSLSESSSPQHLMQSPQQMMQTLREPASPQQLMQTQQMIQSLSEPSSPHQQQLMQSLSESSPPQLMSLGNASPPQLIQTLSEPIPQHQQLMQSSQQMIQTVCEASPQQLIHSMTDSFSRPSSSQCATEASPQLSFSQAMEDSNSQSRLSIAPDETCQHLLMKKQEDNLNFMQQMIHKSEDLKLQQSGGSTVQDMLLMSSAESKLSTELLNYMTNSSDKDTDLKNMMLSDVRPEGNIQFSTANNPVSSGNNLIANTVSSGNNLIMLVLTNDR